MIGQILGFLGLSFVSAFETPSLLAFQGHGHCSSEEGQIRSSIRTIRSVFDLELCKSMCLAHPDSYAMEYNFDTLTCYLFKDAQQGVTIPSQQNVECWLDLQRPTTSPTTAPTDEPTTSRPSISPTDNPSFKPTVSEPSTSPSVLPSFSPSFSFPSQAPSTSPSASPSDAPSISPSCFPSVQPSTSPSHPPSVGPSISPSTSPSIDPSTSPSVTPSNPPSNKPSAHPSTFPSNKPTQNPSHSPSVQPSTIPSTSPTSTLPSRIPSCCPSETPSAGPTVCPTARPSDLPSTQPSTSPSLPPSSDSPSTRPSLPPTTNLPSTAPSLHPASASPSVTPSDSPSFVPSTIPSDCPSSAPTISPSVKPSTSPSNFPSVPPSVNPSKMPSTSPTSSTPSASPSHRPSTNPSRNPSTLPSLSPTSESPSSSPSNAPSTCPSKNPVSSEPSTAPSQCPSTFPSTKPTMNPSSSFPSTSPSPMPSARPSMNPTSNPSYTPTHDPTVPPSFFPSLYPSTNPTQDPTLDPTLSPTFSSWCTISGEALCSACRCRPDAPNTEYELDMDGCAQQAFGNNIAFFSYRPDPDRCIIPDEDAYTQCFDQRQSPSMSTDWSVYRLVCITNSPSYHPTSSPSSIPTIHPTENPSTDPTSDPTSNPTQDPTVDPTIEPTFFPSFIPTGTPSKTPTARPTLNPSFNPTMDPTTDPTSDPTEDPSVDPTLEPTFFPSVFPTRMPSKAPIVHPTWNPSFNPTMDPTTNPTSDPTIDPTLDPSKTPSIDPSLDPSIDPSVDPTTAPSLDPTSDPSQDPTLTPSFDPSLDPTMDPLLQPSEDPTSDPTSDPTLPPTCDPTNDPTLDPSLKPTLDPTSEPSLSPTNDPTLDPTLYPSNDPSLDPTICPSFNPSTGPSLDPTKFPSIYPSLNPSLDPTTTPSSSPSINPTMLPTTDPTFGFGCEITGRPLCSACRCSHASSVVVYEGLNLEECARLALLQRAMLFAHREVGKCHIPSESAIQHCVTDRRTETSNPDWSVYEVACLTDSPSMYPTFLPSLFPTKYPSLFPSFNPTLQPTVDPSGDPTSSPTNDPSQDPSEDPSMEPTSFPSFFPSQHPSTTPTVRPTLGPSFDPTTHPSADPTRDPTTDPILDPTADPTAFPSLDPSLDPTSNPSSNPTKPPSTEPTILPTIEPTIDPTSDPILDPSMDPTFDPFIDPSMAPTADPSSDPTLVPTTDPSVDPTSDPFIDPTMAPTADPSLDPTLLPTTDPTKDPSLDPTTNPTHLPSLFPTTSKPTKTPSTTPSQIPTIPAPSSSPTLLPSMSPSAPWVDGLMCNSMETQIIPIKEVSMQRCAEVCNEYSVLSRMGVVTMDEQASCCLCGFDCSCLVEKNGVRSILYDPIPIAAEPLSRSCQDGVKCAEYTDVVGGTLTLHQCQLKCVRDEECIAIRFFEREGLGTILCRLFSAIDIEATLDGDPCSDTSCCYSVQEDLCVPTNSPSLSPTTPLPSTSPTVSPSNFPSTKPSPNPTRSPTADPTVDPTENPSLDPSVDPSLDPTLFPSIDPTNEPSLDPSFDPSLDPSMQPSLDPSQDPSLNPTGDPTLDPTIPPSIDPTLNPTRDPTIAPSLEPTVDPTHDPTADPTVSPTFAPFCYFDGVALCSGCRCHPNTRQNEFNLTVKECATVARNTGITYFSFRPDPIQNRCLVPRYDDVIQCNQYRVNSTNADWSVYKVTCVSLSPTVTPTTSNPSVRPSNYPTDEPTMDPTVFPSLDPTEDPTNDPTLDPTVCPTFAPFCHFTGHRLCYGCRCHPNTRQNEFDVDLYGCAQIAQSTDIKYFSFRSDPVANRCLVPRYDDVIQCNQYRVNSTNPDWSVFEVKCVTNPPTLDPTQDPSQDPSLDPTIYPTFSPTIDPTQDPTLDPTIFPSHPPSVPPTRSPTDYIAGLFCHTEDRVQATLLGERTFAKCEEFCENFPALDAAVTTINLDTGSCVCMESCSCFHRVNSSIVTQVDTQPLPGFCTESPTLSPSFSQPSLSPIQPTDVPSVSPTYLPTTLPFLINHDCDYTEGQTVSLANATLDSCEQFCNTFTTISPFVGIAVDEDTSECTCFGDCKCLILHGSPFRYIQLFFTPLPDICTPSTTPSSSPTKLPTLSIPSIAPTTSMPSSAPTTSNPTKVPTTPVPSAWPTLSYPSTNPTINPTTECSYNFTYEKCCEERPQLATMIGQKELFNNDLEDDEVSLVGNFPWYLNVTEVEVKNFTNYTEDTWDTQMSPCKTSISLRVNLSDVLYIATKIGNDYIITIVVAGSEFVVTHAGSTTEGYWRSFKEHQSFILLRANTVDVDISVPHRNHTRPTVAPSGFPSNIPTTNPSHSPTSASPTSSPSISLPTTTPSTNPSVSPSFAPTSDIPSTTPSTSPSHSPTADSPSTMPSTSPTQAPTCPTRGPSTSNPSTNPSLFPTQFSDCLQQVCEYCRCDGYQANTGFEFRITANVHDCLQVAQERGMKWFSYRYLSQQCSIPDDDDDGYELCVRNRRTNINRDWVIYEIACPTMAPSVDPSSSYPSMTPTSPTLSPLDPTLFPTTDLPSLYPSSNIPSTFPSVSPSKSPTQCPTTDDPSISPTTNPSKSPSTSPTSSDPSVCPTTAPSTSPTIIPTDPPSTIPTVFPSYQPSETPSISPFGGCIIRLCTDCRCAGFHQSHTVTTISGVDIMTCAALASQADMRYFVYRERDSKCQLPKESDVLYGTDDGGYELCVVRRVSTNIDREWSMYQNACPTISPTVGPTSLPSTLPTIAPTNPTANPSTVPTDLPSTKPSVDPSTSAPSIAPSKGPSATAPSVFPSDGPVAAPSGSPSVVPTTAPSYKPTVKPSWDPSKPPSMKPSFKPSTTPSAFPSESPSLTPTTLPSGAPLPECVSISCYTCRCGEYQNAEKYIQLENMDEKRCWVAAVAIGIDWFNFRPVTGQCNIPLAVSDGGYELCVTNRIDRLTMRDWHIYSTRCDSPTVSPTFLPSDHPILQPSFRPVTSDPSTSPETWKPSTSPETWKPSTSPETWKPSTSPETWNPSTSPETWKPSTSPGTRKPSTSPGTWKPSEIPLMSYKPTSSTPTKTPNSALTPTAAPTAFDCDSLTIENTPFDGVLSLQSTLFNGNPWWTSPDGSLAMVAEELAGLGKKWIITMENGYLVYEPRMEDFSYPPPQAQWIHVHDTDGVIATYPDVLLTCMPASVSTNPSTGPSFPPVSSDPSTSPEIATTKRPSAAPSTSPVEAPSSLPTHSLPSLLPSTSPSLSPSLAPTESPTSPTTTPSISPSSGPCTELLCEYCRCNGYQDDSTVVKLVIDLEGCAQYAISIGVSWFSFRPSTEACAIPTGVSDQGFALCVTERITGVGRDWNTYFTDCTSESPTLTPTPTIPTVSPSSPSTSPTVSPTSPTLSPIPAVTVCDIDRYCDYCRCAEYDDPEVMRYYSDVSLEECANNAFLYGMTYFNWRMSSRECNVPRDPGFIILLSLESFDYTLCVRERYQRITQDWAVYEAHCVEISERSVAPTAGPTGPTFNPSVQPSSGPIASTRPSEEPSTPLIVMIQVCSYGAVKTNSRCDPNFDEIRDGQDLDSCYAWARSEGKSHFAYRDHSTRRCQIQADVPGEGHSVYCDEFAVSAGDTWTRYAIFCDGEPTIDPTLEPTIEDPGDGTEICVYEDICTPGESCHCSGEFEQTDPHLNNRDCELHAFDNDEPYYMIRTDRDRCRMPRGSEIDITRNCEENHFQHSNSWRIFKRVCTSIPDGGGTFEDCTIQPQFGGIYYRCQNDPYVQTNEDTMEQCAEIAYNRGLDYFSHLDRENGAKKCRVPELQESYALCDAETTNWEWTVYRLTGCDIPGLISDPCDGVVCTPKDECHEAGICEFGTCTEPPISGIPCSGGTCQSGVCEGGEIEDHCVGSAPYLYRDQARCGEDAAADYFDGYTIVQCHNDAVALGLLYYEYRLDSFERCGLPTEDDGTASCTGANIRGNREKWQIYATCVDDPSSQSIAFDQPDGEIVDIIRLKFSQGPSANRWQTLKRRVREILADAVDNNLTYHTDVQTGFELMDDILVEDYTEDRWNLVEVTFESQIEPQL